MRDGSEISGPGDKRESGGNRAERRTCAGSVHCVRSGAGKPRVGAANARRRDRPPKRRRKMNPTTLLQQPFFQVTLPILIGMFATVWALVSTNNRRLDDIRADLKDFRADIKDFRSEVNTRFGQVNGHLDHIDETLKTYGQKIAVLEDRSSPLARR